MSRRLFRRGAARSREAQARNNKPHLLKPKAGEPNFSVGRALLRLVVCSFSYPWVVSVGGGRMNRERNLTDSHASKASHAPSSTKKTCPAKMCPARGPWRMHRSGGK